jgi:hypothetical protein
MDEIELVSDKISSYSSSSSLSSEAADNDDCRGGDLAGLGWVIE